MQKYNFFKLYIILFLITTHSFCLTVESKNYVQHFYSYLKNLISRPASKNNIPNSDVQKEKNNSEKLEELCQQKKTLETMLNDDLLTAEQKTEIFNAIKNLEEDISKEEITLKKPWFKQKKILLSSLLFTGSIMSYHLYLIQQERDRLHQFAVHQQRIQAKENKILTTFTDILSITNYPNHNEISFAKTPSIKDPFFYKWSSTHLSPRPCFTFSQSTKIFNGPSYPKYLEQEKDFTVTLNVLPLDTKYDRYDTSTLWTPILHIKPNATSESEKFIALPEFFNFFE